MSRSAIIHVSPNLIRDALQLPPTTEVTGALWDPSVAGGSVDLIVEDPDLDEVAEGSKIPTVSPSVKKTFDWGK